MAKVNYVVGYADDALFGRSVADALKCPFVPFRNEYYPEGAPAPKIAASYDDINGSHVLTVYRRRQLPERNTVCRFLANYPRIVKSLSDPETFAAAKVDVFHPYFVLGRQDHNPKTDPSERVRRKDAGKDMGYKYEASLFRGCNVLLTFHPHWHRAPGEFDVEGVHMVGLDAVPSMVKYARQMGMDKNCIAISPDLSGGDGYSIAKRFAEEAGLAFAFIGKEREGPSRIRDNGDILDARGKDVIIADDIACTLTTLQGATRAIQNHGEMDAYFVHAVLPEDGHTKAQSLTRGSGGPLTSIAATDCIDSDFSSISIIDRLVEFYETHKGT